MCPPNKQNRNAGDQIAFENRRFPLGRLSPPASGEIHAWYLDLGELARSLRIALDGHDDGSSQAGFTAGQLRFARWFYLRLLLGAYLGVPGKDVHINRSDRGKPVLDSSYHEQELHFSLAKSEDRLMAGFSSTHHLGVDLEPAQRKAHDPLGVAKRYFSPAEAGALAALPAERRHGAFLHTWACKEAVVKASGQGIANQLCRFAVDTDPLAPPRVLEFDGRPAPDWSLRVLHPEPGFLAAIAVHDPDVEVRAHRLRPA